MGIDFLTKTIYVDDKMVRMQIWDTAGQEKFHCLIPQYIQDSSVAVVTYDITCKYPFIIQTKSQLGLYTNTSRDIWESFCNPVMFLSILKSILIGFTIEGEKSLS